MSGISPKLPLATGFKNGVYELNTDVLQAMGQNLKNLVLTSPGERMMDPLFGVGLRNFLFEQNVESVYNDVSSTIYQQVNLYLPQIKIQNIVFNQAATDPDDIDHFVDNSILSIRIEYLVKPVTKVQSLTIPIK
jgi:phage baseplate assembly protein W